MMSEINPHGHYFRDVSGLQKIDVYRLLELFDVTCPVAQHIVKKALAAGKRGAKDSGRDMKDIQDSAARWLEMRQEDLVSAVASMDSDIQKTAGTDCSFWGTSLHHSASAEELKNAAARTHSQNSAINSVDRLGCVTVVAKK